jgi:hypothetical protein
MLCWLNTNAAAVQAVGSVIAIFVAIFVAWWQTWVSRSDQADARRRTARVLAMELLPNVQGIDANLARAARPDWNNLHHTNIPALQARRIEGIDALEGALDRLAVLDDDTLRPIHGVLFTVRDLQPRSIVEGPPPHARG